MKHEIKIDICGVRASGKTTIMLLMKQALANMGYTVKLPKGALQADQDAIVSGLEVFDQTYDTTITFTESLEITETVTRVVNNE